MSKILLVIDMSDEEYKLFKMCKGEKIVDIGHDYDKDDGWAFIRKKLLAVKPIPEKIPHDDGYEDVCEYWSIESYNDCIDELLKGEEELNSDIEFDINVIGLVNYIKRKNEYIFEESTIPHDEGTANIFTLDREHSLSVNMIAEIMYEGKGDITFFKSLLDELQDKNIIKRRVTKL